jgi:phenylalanyl-tRNA synthetase beta chain
MIFSYKWIKEYIKGRLPEPKKLAELLTMHSFEVEEAKRARGDSVLAIDVLPNRAVDCFSHIGIARECAVLTNSKFQMPDANSREEKKLKAKDFISVEVRDKRACPRYTAKAITGVKVGTSPKWLKERLKICGLRPINNIVDIANYVMLETGQPLHAFDGEKLEGEKIIVRFAKNREKIVTLDEDVFDLGPNILVIADEKKPVAIAGIKGGKIPEIDKKTKVVIVESANFNPQIIRRGSQKLKLKTDASIRYEHGIDPNLTELAAKRVCYLIQKIAKGKIAQGAVDVYSQKVFPKRVRLDLNYAKSLLGIEVPKREIIKIFKNLEFKIKKLSKNTLEVLIPTRRLDISIPEDLIEEIGRVSGYGKIKADFPTSSLIPPKRNLDIFWEDVTKNILKETGFTEVYNYSFFGEKEAKLFGYKKNELIEVENPISVEHKYLRASLIPNLLKNVEKNSKQFREIRIFELGEIFTLRQAQDKKEKRQLTGLISGEGFYWAKGVVDLLLNKLGISNVWYDDYGPTPEESKAACWHPKKCAEIKIDGEEIGFLGEISPRILDSLSIPEKVVLFDIDFKKLSKLASEEHEYRPISKFPAAVRDIAILVPRMIKVEEVLNKIEEAGGDLIRDIDLFDIYEGEELPQGKKNLAFHIIYQAKDRTLSPKEIDEVQNKITKRLGKNPDWQVRK